MALNALGLGIVLTAKDLASGVISRIADEFGELEGVTDEVKAAFEGATKQFDIGVAIFSAGIAGLAALSATADVARDFGQAMAEVSTLTDEATFSVAAQSEITAGLIEQFGGQNVAQARGLYQAISAGASTAESATAILTTANRLAIGGVTDLTTATDALTTATNTYAAQGLTAEQASDALFVAMRAGKTTVGELGSSLGRVVPTAESLNVSFGDTLAAVSAITTKGIATTEAVTGLKAAFANILRPTKSAEEEAKRLGVAFDAASLRTMGLAGFLESITTSSKFTADSFSKLFESTDALNALTALTANNAGKFNEILAGMENRAGATADAFAKMEAQLAFSERRFAGLQERVLAVIGEAIVPIKKAVVDFASALLKAFLAIPKPIISFGVLLFGIASAALAVTGAIIAAKAALTIFSIVAGTTVFAALAPIGLLLLKVAAIIGAVMLVVSAFRALWESDIGGISTFFREVFGDIKLVFDALTQIFEQGGISGAVREELNSGSGALKRFVAFIAGVIFRVQDFVEGFGGAFDDLTPIFEPVFEGLITAFQQVGRAFEPLLDSLGLGELAVQGTGGAFKIAGAIIGSVVSAVVQLIAGAVAIIVPLISGIVAVVAILIDAFTTFGRIIGATMAVVVGLLTGDWALAFEGAKNIALEAIGFVIRAFGTLVEIAAGSLDSLLGIFGIDLGASDFVVDLRATLEEELKDLGQTGLDDVRAISPGTPGGPAGAAAGAAAISPAATAVGEQTRTAMVTPSLQDVRPVELRATLPIILDGEQIGESQTRIRRSEAAASFEPVMAE